MEVRWFFLLFVLTVALSLTVAFSHQPHVASALPSELENPSVTYSESEPHRATGEQSSEVAAFRMLTLETLLSLPTNEQVSSNQANHPHDVPFELEGAAAKLGAIIEGVQKNTQLRPQAIRFYLKCGANKNILFAVRTLCTRNFVDLSSAANKSFDTGLRLIASSVQDAAADLPKAKF